MKLKQQRIDYNDTTDFEIDKPYMISYLQDTDRVKYEDLLILRKHYEQLAEVKLLKLESSIWLILIHKEIYRRDNLTINKI